MRRRHRKYSACIVQSHSVARDSTLRANKENEESDGEERRDERVRSRSSNADRASAHEYDRRLSLWLILPSPYFIPVLPLASLSVSRACSAYLSRFFASDQLTQRTRAPTGQTEKAGGAGGGKEEEGWEEREEKGREEKERGRSEGGAREERADVQVSANSFISPATPAHKKGASQHSPRAPFVRRSVCHRRLLAQADSDDALATAIYHSGSSIPTARYNGIAQLRRDRRAPN